MSEKKKAYDPKHTSSLHLLNMVVLLWLGYVCLPVDLAQLFMISLMKATA